MLRQDLLERALIHLPWAVISDWGIVDFDKRIVEPLEEQATLSMFADNGVKAERRTNIAKELILVLKAVSLRIVWNIFG